MEDIFNTTEEGGLLAYDLPSAEKAISALPLGVCRKYYKEITDDNISADLQSISEGNEGAMLEALNQRIKLLEKQGRSKGTFNVAHEFEVAPVTINFRGKNGKGKSTHVLGDRDVDVECVAGIASHASAKKSGVVIEQAKLARRLAALVKQKPGSKSSPQVTNMPKMLRTIDYSSKASALARVVKGSLPGLVRSVMNDFSTASQVSQVIYSRPPSELEAFVSDHQGFKFIGKQVDVHVEPYKTEQANKKAIKEMLNVYPGQRGGPGNLAASHMDGIPLTGKMRTMLDHVQDFNYQKADVYFFTGSKSQVYTSIYKAILKHREHEGDEDRFIVTYVNDNTVSQRVLAEFVEVDDRGAVSKVLKSGIICGKVPPSGGPKVRTCYVDFTEPKRASKDKISMEADTARKVLLDKMSAVQGYTYYQMYASYLTMSFPVDYKKDEQYSIRDPATWDDTEKYLPSVLGRKGVMIMSNSKKGYNAVEMSAIMLNMIYHSILYVYVGQHTRKFAMCAFPDTVSVDFSLASTIRTVASAITGSLSDLGDILGKKFRDCIDEKIAERHWKESQEKTEKERIMREADEKRVEAAKLEVKTSKKIIHDEEKDHSGEESEEEEPIKEEKKIMSTPKVKKRRKYVRKKQKEQEISASTAFASGEAENLFGEM
jgi:hypothetical protein